MAWTLGLGLAGGVALFAVGFSAGGWGGLGNFLSADNASSAVTPLDAMAESDGAVVHAVYSAGTVQDLGTFGGYQNSGASSGNSAAITGSSFNAGDSSEIASLYSNGVARPLGSSLASSGDILAGLNLGLTSSPAAYRSSSSRGAAGGWSGGSGGARNQAGGVNYGGGSAALGGGAGETAVSSSGNAFAGLQANNEQGPAVSGSAENGKAAESSFVTVTNDNQAALLADAVLLGDGTGAGVPGLLLAEGVSNPGGNPATIQSDVIEAFAENDARVPEAAATWALFTAALAGLTILRRLSA